MASLKERVIDATKHFDSESLRLILTSTDLANLPASGLSIEEILAAAIRSDDKRLAESCLVVGVPLSQQVDGDAETYNSLMALMAQAAAKWDKIDILEYCLDRGVKPSTYLSSMAAVCGSERSFQLLMSRGLDINAHYGYGGDALCNAARGNKLSMAKFLINSGAHVQCGFMFLRLYGPLACAAMEGSPEMLELLISKGAVITGSLALHQAAAFGQTDNMEYLITTGADVNEMPQDEGTFFGADIWPGRPIHFAAEARTLPAVKVLLEHGADPTLLNFTGQTVLEVSIHDGEPWKELENLLREIGCSLI